MAGSDLQLQKSTEWMPGERPYYFFGPCSAETREQVLQTAEQLSPHFKNLIFRAGLWKPRTRPNSFEGVGVEGLEWLKEVKQQYNFKITTEVANPQHLEACLKAGVDMLWIGARTTVNPFSVQEIATALQGVDIPVFVKNPINPDLSLWMGALERINKAGIQKLGAIHRGFHLPDNQPYRNYPDWDIAIRLRAAYPQLPLICDASHISGKPDLIAHVAQKAIDLDMDGLMVETHPHPEKALSDKQQQITPEHLNQIIQNLTPKSPSSADPEFKNELEQLRAKIDKIDEDLLEKVATRMELAKEIGMYKKENQVTVLQVNRWQKILEKSLKNGQNLGLSEKFIRQMLNNIHDESIRQQTDVIKKKYGPD